ncbi:hypothetical protein B0H16DRAFT_1559241 [Mycena metata]|uniref:Uncharacterized protein n=1 Tax=Mycena metata TaxID=1033252 RepID=A0AAD7N4G8_9AGAR|nr:hypothetical protein B0H16DRAFT_1559241 [Mycena metata]
MNWPWNLLPICGHSNNDRLAAPSAPTSFVPLWALSAPCCKKCSAPSLRVRPSDVKLAVPDCVYTEGGHRRNPTPNKFTSALPRVFVSTSNVSVRPSPPPRTSQVYNWPLIIALAPFFESLGYGTGTTHIFSTCLLAQALILRIGLYHHPSFKRAA